MRQNVIVDEETRKPPLLSSARRCAGLNGRVVTEFSYSVALDHSTVCLLLWSCIKDSFGPGDISELADIQVVNRMVLDACECYGDRELSAGRDLLAVLPLNHRESILYRDVCRRVKELYGTTSDDSN